MKVYEIQLVITELKPPALAGKKVVCQNIIRQEDMNEWVLQTILKDMAHEVLPRLRDRSSVNSGAAAPVFPA